MSKEEAESKLREYNNWMLLYLTMHEALPGHYTQFEHANNLHLSPRRVLRVLLGNNPYEEGWGEYAVKEMEDAGYDNHDPRFVLMIQKIRLRVIANADSRHSHAEPEHDRPGGSRSNGEEGLSD